jgi:NAD(P)-dependent dehydrogenase (short-subunit alcohol dehydrogenase family)
LLHIGRATASALEATLKPRSLACFGAFSQRLRYDAASKGGILALGKVLAMEYGRYGIRVNTVSPGGTDIADRVTPRLLIRPGFMAGSTPASLRRLQSNVVTQIPA